MSDPSETTQVSLESREPEASELLGAVRTLSAQVGGLQTELHALRAQVRPLPDAGDAPGWNEGSTVRREASPWVRSLERPASRGPAVPRLLVEIVFLAAVALAAAIAELDPVVIVLLMAGAWALVAAAEWIAARAAARHAQVLDAPLAHAGAYLAEDPSWFGPPVERTAVEDGDGAESGPARLPPPSDD